MGARFFKPFVGTKYHEGIKGKRILIVGASFYCNHTECPYFAACTDVERKDSSMYDTTCPPYAPYGMCLSDTPTYTIDDQPKTYRTFAAYMAKHVGSNDYHEIWNHLAFTNYVQFFLPSSKNGFRETRIGDLSERDYEAFNETIAELQPDIVIIWGCVFNTRLKEENDMVPDKDMLPSTEWYMCHIHHPRVSHPITLLNPYHPSYSAWYSALDTFDKYLSRELDNK